MNQVKQDIGPYTEKLIADYFWTKNQIAKIRNVSRSWVDRHLKDKGFPEAEFSVGRTALYLKSKVEAYFDEQMKGL